MKVRDLIAALERCLPDEDVFVAYDSAACVEALEVGQIVRVSEAKWGKPDGVWFFSEGIPYIDECIADGDAGVMTRVLRQ